MTTSFQEDDSTPQILYGDSAHSVDTLAGDENVLKMMVCSATWRTDDEIEFQDESGDAYITQDKMIFLCSATKDHSVSIDAECIQLHAQSEDCVVYFQVQDFSSKKEEVLEFTMKLSSQSDCERFFDAISLLVSMHPVNDEDDDFEMGNENYDDEMVINQSQQDTNLQIQGSEEPTDEERDAMLDRLDALLVVPPDLEKPGEDDEDDISGGQFDDADVDELI